MRRPRHRSALRRPPRGEQDRRWFEVSTFGVRRTPNPEPRTAHPRTPNPHRLTRRRATLPSMTVHARSLPLLTERDVLAGLKAQRSRQPVDYSAFYSSQMKGVVTDP